MLVPKLFRNKFYQIKLKVQCYHLLFYKDDEWICKRSIYTSIIGSIYIILDGPNWGIAKVVIYLQSISQYLIVGIQSRFKYCLNPIIRKPYMRLIVFTKFFVWLLIMCHYKSQVHNKNGSFMCSDRFSEMLCKINFTLSCIAWNLNLQLLQAKYLLIENFIHTISKWQGDSLITLLYDKHGSTVPYLHSTNYKYSQFHL